MINIALLGDSTVQQYAIANRLWELISVVINERLKLVMFPAETPAEAYKAFEVFKKDTSFAGLIIATSAYQKALSAHVERREDIVFTPAGNDIPIIDTMYRDQSGKLIGANAGPLAAQQALEAKSNLYKSKSALIIGMEGAGLPIAYHLYHNLDKTAYLYDPSASTAPEQPGVITIAALSEAANRTYDIIVNATPLGRYYVDKRVEAFTSPLDLETLQRISHTGTIVQETNYLPGTTLLLQMARHLKLKVVTGNLMLVFEALECLKRFLGATIDENTVSMLVEEISAYITDRELMILGQTD